MSEVTDRVRWNAEGLVPVVVTEYTPGPGSGEVLMLAWMDDEALTRSLDSGRATYWSRSRQEYWIKGETSGHKQWVRELRIDCDGDTLLLTVEQEGAACHTGDRTCFDSGLLAEIGPRSDA